MSISPWVLISYLLVGFIVLLTMWFLWTIRSHRLAVINKVWATFYTEGQTRYHALCEVTGVKVKPPAKGDHKGLYLLKPHKTVEDLWPPGWPSILQVSVRTVSYREKHEEPLDPYDTPAVGNAALLLNIEDEKFTGHAVNQALERERQEKMARRASSPIFILLGLGLLLILLIVQLVLSFQMVDGVDTINTNLGL